MRFKAKKVYGEYKRLTCPLCTRSATQKNDQGLDVCHLHTKEILQDIKCTCGAWLDLRVGKFGPYYNCMDCGNMNFKRAMEIKSITAKDVPKVVEEKRKEPVKKEPKEIFITTDDVEYFS